MSPSPELMLTVFMLGCLAGLGIACIIEALSQRRARLDRKTDEYMRRGMRTLSEREIDELLTRKPRPVSPRDFVIRDRNGQPIHFEDDRHGAA